MKTINPQLLVFISLTFLLATCSKEDDPDPAQLSLSPASLNFGDETTVDAFKISNTGDETLEWAISADQSWISCNPDNGLTNDMEAEIIVTVDRTGLIPATYSGQITVTSNVGDKSIDVNMDKTYGVIKIAFSRETPDNMDIFTMNTDGSSQQQLTQNAEENMMPCWTPEGSHLIFVSDRYNETGSDIFRMNFSGTQATPLSSGSEDYFPAVSPDGSKILFLRYFEGQEHDFGEIFIMNIDGTNKIQLTSNMAYLWGATWSRDGQKIYFSSNLDGDYDIFSMNADGTNQFAITQNDSNDRWPSVSVNNLIIFYSDRDGDNEIYSMNNDGSNTLQLTSNDVSDWAPSCSRTENMIAFVSRRDGDNEIFVMNTDGTSVQQLTQNDTDDIHPNW